MVVRYPGYDNTRGHNRKGIRTMGYILMIGITILSPLIISWIVVGLYLLIFRPDSSESTWVKTGGTLLGLRYSLKLFNNMFTKRRR